MAWHGMGLLGLAASLEKVGSCSSAQLLLPAPSVAQAISEGRSCVVQLLNYKRSGDPFINLLSVTPIYDASGTLTHYVGIQVGTWGGGG